LAALQAKPAWRKMNLWSYVDVEDAGEACRSAVEADLQGHQKMIIAAADTLMSEPSQELLAQYFPNVPMQTPIEGNQSFLSSAHAEAVIGYHPKHSWRTRTVGKI
jgi:hypothetical protein